MEYLHRVQIMYDFIQECKPISIGLESYFPFRFELVFLLSTIEEWALEYFEIL